MEIEDKPTASGEPLTARNPSARDARRQPDRESDGVSRRGKSLWNQYNETQSREFRDPTAVSQILDAMAAGGLGDYTAPPDVWHNLAMTAARVRNRDVELALVMNGLEQGIGK